MYSVWNWHPTWNVFCVDWTKVILFLRNWHRTRVEQPRFSVFSERKSAFYVYECEDVNTCLHKNTWKRYTASKEESTSDICEYEHVNTCIQTNVCKRYIASKDILLQKSKAHLIIKNIILWIHAFKRKFTKDILLWKNECTYTLQHTLQHTATHCTTPFILHLSMYTAVYILQHTLDFAPKYTLAERWGAGVEYHFQEI